MIHLAKVSEELGFTHIWVGDSHLIWREAYVNMAAMVLNTTKVKFGTGVTNPLTRHPSVLASAYATLEEYSPGRMIVGIGLGDSSVETMGLKPSTLAQFRKTIGSKCASLFAGKEAATAEREDSSASSVQKQSADLYRGQRAEDAGTIGPHRRRDHCFGRRC